MAQATLSEMGTESYLAALGREYGKPGLDVYQESVILWEQFALGKRDQGGNLTERQTPGQLLPRVIYEVLKRFEGKGPTWPVDRTPIPETTYKPTDTPRDQVYWVLLDFLEQCQWSRALGVELVLADNRAYVKANEAERTLDRIEQAYGSLLTAHRLPPDAEVMELREQLRCCWEIIADARDKGFVFKGKGKG